MYLKFEYTFCEEMLNVHVWFSGITILLHNIVSI